MNKYPLRIILSDIRSAQNVGAILRTADAAEISLVYACGYTPYPLLQDDLRPAHIADANTRSIAKTALGAERTVPLLHFSSTLEALRQARSDGFSISVIEQADNSLNLYEYRPAGPLALVLGNEVDGVSPDIIASADVVLELPMLGGKESLNVSVAAGIAMYQLRFGTES
jgi:tRNA G18 (ribose-2'-O)-methylase SpoU